MTIIVLGPNGFVGSHLVARLEKDGHKVVPYERGLRLAVRSYDVVVNCAGQVDDPSKMYCDNVTLVYDWLESLPNTARFVQVGSSSETGPMEGPRSEDVICHPSNIYEHTKP